MSELKKIPLEFFPHSIVQQDDLEVGMVRSLAGNRLALLSREIPAGFQGERSEHGGKTLLLGAPNPKNAAALRALLPWLTPRPLGLQTSAGMGDRVGLATPGHVRAAHHFEGRVVPIFAQQSMREMSRTRRNPQVVMDDATWGIFQEGWRLGVGADADHLKSTTDIDVCLAAGYTFYTIDPGAHVDNSAETADLGALGELVQRLPEEHQPEKSGLAGKEFKIEGKQIRFDEPTLLRAAAKYGHALAHVAKMYRHLALAAGSRPYELEVSVDETDLPTSHAEHVYIASELKRLGVKWVSLAPRYVGRFEKGVDYIGDLAAFEDDLAGHAAIARKFGPYKLSLHSGSDKFSIYEIVVKHTDGMAHLKTAGTSYLEALRTIAAVQPDLLHEIYDFALERYEHDRASYHVSAQVKRAPLPKSIKDWTLLLDQFDAREILHVTFGSVLTDTTITGDLRFQPRFMEFLRLHPEEYALSLEWHFIRHLQPFARQEPA